MTLLPFRLKDTWFAIELEHIISIDCCDNIAYIPNATSPIVGLTQKIGKIYSVISLYDLVEETPIYLNNLYFAMRLMFVGKEVFLPVDEIHSVINSPTGWKRISAYGLRVYKSLENMPVQFIQEKDPIVIQKPETPISQFIIEDISS